jgi:hypothetical protein
MDGVEIGRRLRQMPVEASVVFAVRTGLRMLLWVAQSKEKQVLMRWEEKDRVRHLLAVFLAFDKWQTTNGFRLLVSIRGGLPSGGDVFVWMGQSLALLMQGDCMKPTIPKG